MQGAILTQLLRKKSSELSYYSPQITMDMPKETENQLQKINLEEHSKNRHEISGAPQAGKHLVAERLKARLPQHTLILNENDFYLPPEGQEQFSLDYNFDDPISIE